MEKLIKQAKQKHPDFNQLTTQQQFDILKKLNPKITPEDLVYHYEQRYYQGNDENWTYYLENYLM